MTPRTSIPGTAYLADPDFTLHNGDALEVLKTLPDESIHCVVTSPPYWGLRDYGTGTWEGGDEGCDHARPTTNYNESFNERWGQGSGQKKQEKKSAGQYGVQCGKCGARRVDNQLGLESTPDEYVAKMVEVFREVRRVLRKDGTCWLNIGDSYAGSWGAQSRGNTTGEAKSRTEGTSMLSARQIESHPLGLTGTGSLKRTPGMKPKDLCMIPARLALALQADGWYLRSEITWCKPNPMPESVTDRPTQATEKVYLLSKSARYFYDAEAVRERADWERWGAQTPRKTGDDKSRGASFIKERSRQELLEMAGQRNLRNWWQIATEPYPEAHFATYPTELVRRCILAGTSERGCCPECGAPWVREVDVQSEAKSSHDWRDRWPPTTDGHNTVQRGDITIKTETTGWRPSCDHFGNLPEIFRDRPGALRLERCTVLDPFCGSGTTAFVARKHGRRCIGVELSADYCELAARRTSQLSLEAEVA